MKIPNFTRPFSKESGDETLTPRRYSNRLILFLVVLVVILTIVVAFMAASLQKALSTKPADEGLDTNYNTNTRIWNISKIEPSGSGDFKVSMTSSAGNIRTYENLISFGLSNDKEYLATFSLKGIEIIKLEDETVVQGETNNQKLAGSLGNSIQWSLDSKHFALSLYLNDDTSKTKILIFNSEGKLTKEIESNIIVSSEKINDTLTLNVVETPQFSKLGNMLLVRTFKVDDLEITKEDGTPYKKDELPIYLTMYDIDGNISREFNIRDFDTSGTNIYYRWDNQGKRFVDYIIYEANESVDPTQDFLFTKIGF